MSEEESEESARSEYWKAEHLAGNKIIDELRARIAELEAMYEAACESWGEASDREQKTFESLLQLTAQIAAHERVCAGTWVPTEHGGHLNAIAIHFDNLFGQAHALDYRGYTTHLLKPELPTSSGEG